MASSRPSLLITEPDDFPPPVLDSLRTWTEVHLGPIAPGSLGATFASHDIVWAGLRHRLRGADIPAGCRCRILAVPVTGLDHIDLDGCAAANIRVASLRGEVAFLRNIRPTAEHTIALVLALLRRLPAAHASVLEGRWDREAFQGHELYGGTAGIIGMGRLGTALARYYHAFDMRVLGHDTRADFPEGPARRCDSLDELLAESDIISVHVAYHPGTRHLIHAGNLARVRPGAVLVNTARGGVIDDTALLDALRSGRLAGAALDVVDGEPDVGRDHPLVRYAREHENLILTPHIAGNTTESREKTAAFVAQKVRQMWMESPER